MAQPQFDPSKPFTVQGTTPTFDPSKPFTTDFQTTNQKDAQGRPVVDESFTDRLLAAVPILGQMAESTGQHPLDIVKGLAKSALGTVEGGGQLIRSIPGIGPALASAGSVHVPVDVTPQNTGERIGKGVGDVGQFFLPAGALSKAKTALATGSGLLDALVAAGLEGTSAAAVNSAQSGTTKDALRTGLSTAGTGLALQGVLKAGQAGANWLGQRIEKAVLKPTGPALEGMSPSQLVSNIYKHDVGGTLSQSYDKVQNKIDALTNSLRSVLQSSSAKGGGVSLNQVAQETSDSYLNNPQAQKAVQQILDHVEFALNRQGIPAGTGVMDLADGNIAKQAVGDLGAWTHGLKGNTVADAGVNAVTEDVANRFYNKLKTAIEQNATTGPVKTINKQLSELLPIRQAIIRRIPVAERVNVIHLGDQLAALSPHYLGIGLANRLLGSGIAANALVQGAGADLSALPTIAGRVSGAATTTPFNPPRVTGGQP